jgi:hypothetical protein
VFVDRQVFRLRHAISPEKFRRGGLRPPFSKQEKDQMIKVSNDQIINHKPPRTPRT